ncbi:MAG: DUF2339 domain-containing protein [Actinomycetota bacterium]|nr:DUF2339 domain-containing protein [Actinomycetota bacterium]
MHKRVDDKLVERVERLEREAEEMREELRRLNGHKLDRLFFGPLPVDSREEQPQRRPETVVAHPLETSREVQSEGREGRSEKREGGSSGGLPFDLGDLGDYRSGEWWLGKIGVGLLLFGVAFLYLLSVERGWITPTVRVGFGLTLGTTLTALGLRTFGERRSFSRVLLGGGVGVFYATGFAAYNLYALVPHALAFGFMVAVTLLAFFLSVRGSGVTLSLIGTVGALGVPFVLYDGSGTFGGLVLYACVVLAGTGAIYAYKGWASLLAVSFVGGWAVFLTGFWSNPSGTTGRYPEDPTALQLGVVFAWLLFWLVPALREVSQARNPSALPPPTNAIITDATLAHATSVSSPLMALAFTQAIWAPENETLGFITLAAAALYALAALTFRHLEGAHRQASPVSFTQALVALLLLTLSVVLVLDGEALLFTLAAEAAVLHHAARRISSRVLSYEAHFLWAVVAIWLCGRLLFGLLVGSFDGPFPAPFLGVASLTDLAVIALAFSSSRALSPWGTITLYRALAHAAVLCWLARELLPLPEGESWALLSWTLYAAGLHLISRRLPNQGTGELAHVVSAAVAVWLGARLVGAAVTPGYPGAPVLNAWGVADLFVIALLALAGLLPGAVSPRRIARVYGLVAHIAFLAWLWRELSIPPGGEAYVTVAWGVYAVALLVSGLRLDRVPLFRGSMTTLFLVVGKLFLVDLASIEAVWRVLLFLGFGALFLALSFYTRSLWHPRPSGSATISDDS